MSRIIRSAKRVGTDPMRFRFDIVVRVLNHSANDRLPVGSHVSVVFSRGNKVITTSEAVSTDTGACWEETITTVSTVYKNRKTQAFQSKGAKLTVRRRDLQQSGKVGYKVNYKGIGVARVDMANYCGLSQQTCRETFQLSKCSDSNATLELTITTAWLKDYQRCEGSVSTISAASGVSMDVASFGSFDEGEINERDNDLISSFGQWAGEHSQWTTGASGGTGGYSNNNNDDLNNFLEHNSSDNNYSISSSRPATSTPTGRVARRVDEPGEYRSSLAVLPEEDVVEDVVDVLHIRNLDTGRMEDLHDLNERNDMLLNQFMDQSRDFWEKLITSNNNSSDNTNSSGDGTTTTAAATATLTAPSSVLLRRRTVAALGGPAAPPWDDDDSVACCSGCRMEFTLFYRRHHCRCCGHIFCASCAPATNKKSVARYGQMTENGFLESPPLRHCNGCFSNPA